MVIAMFLRRWSWAALVAPKPHVNRLVDDALLGLTDDDGIPLIAE